MIHAMTTVILIALGGLGGLAAKALGLPLPFMLGALLVSAGVAIALPRHLPGGYGFPPGLRLVFISVIGLVIGAQVSPELFARLGDLLLSLAALTVFVGVALAYNVWVFSRIGGYDRVTAFYCSTPGGLFESLQMGEEAGADVVRLTLQQFLRIIVVVTTLPIALSLYLGEPVGSAGGMTMARAQVPWSALPVLIASGVAGYWLGRLLRLPARQLTGPMLVAALLTLSGLVQIDMPQWLIDAAQVVVGTALGLRFTGVSRALVLRGGGLAVLSVFGMLALAAGFAALLAPATGEPFDVLLISFAPGGVTEMALVALSLQANPAFVTLHHIYRILITVLALIARAKLWPHKL
jgi:membrane AbrB-like protein